MELAEQIQKLDFDHPFMIVDGVVKDAPKSIYAPSVYHDDADDITMDGDSTWYAISGFTGQYNYNGAVMHASEQMSGAIAEHLEEIVEGEPRSVFCLVVVESDDSEEPAGWTVVYTDDWSA